VNRRGHGGKVNEDAVNAGSAYFFPATFCVFFRDSGRILDSWNPVKYTANFQVNLAGNMGICQPEVFPELHQQIGLRFALNASVKRPCYIDSSLKNGAAYCSSARNALTGPASLPHLRRRRAIALPVMTKSNIASAADFARAFSVSHETVEKLELYERLLIQWQKAVNLVAPATIPQIWQRHFADSAQLLALAPDAKIWVDLGSGGGFPALVIAIMLANQGDCFVHLIESNARKAAFLSEVVRQTGAPARVHNARIADAAASGAVPAADVITARALAPLDTLLELALPFFSNASAGLFLKGREAQSEIADARKRWVFEVKIHPSISDAQGRILEVRNPGLIGGEQ
jgi:16S rRNA (guanine527-N7)-methyltransferase